VYIYSNCDYIQIDRPGKRNMSPSPDELGERACASSPGVAAAHRVGAITPSSAEAFDERTGGYNFGRLHVLKNF
jgi:hypothetical protein